MIKNTERLLTGMKMDKSGLKELLKMGNWMDSLFLGIKMDKKNSRKLIRMGN